jgi:biopolymer transport protein ExbD
MARKKRRASEHPGELNLTAMIDVAFQLLSFFVMVSHPMDVMTALGVNRPAPQMGPPPADKPSLLEIMVYKDGFVFQGRKVNIAEVERQLGKYAKMSTNTTIIIKCTLDSRHKTLIQVLDICSKLKLTNISLFSL